MLEPIAPQIQHPRPAIVGLPLLQLGAAPGLVGTLKRHLQLRRSTLEARQHLHYAIAEPRLGPFAVRRFPGIGRGDEVTRVGQRPRHVDHAALVDAVDLLVSSQLDAEVLGQRAQLGLQELVGAQTRQLPRHHIQVGDPDVIQKVAARLESSKAVLRRVADAPRAHIRQVEVRDTEVRHHAHGRRQVVFGRKLVASGARY